MGWVPVAGMDSVDVFGGFVDFSSGNAHCLALDGSDTFACAFSNLDSASCEFAVAAPLNYFQSAT